MRSKLKAANSALQKETALVFGICFIIGILISGVYLGGWLDFIEAQTFDLRTAIQSKFSSKAIGSPEIAVIAADEESVDALGAWPWPHGMFTPMVDILTRTNAEAVGLLVWFNREGDDKELAETLNGSSVYLVSPPITDASHQDAVPLILEWADPPKLLLDNARDTSFAYSNLLAEEPLRKIQLVAKKTDGEYIYSLDLLLLCDYFGIDASKLSKAVQVKESFWRGKYIQITPPNGRRPLRIPMDDQGRLLVNTSVNHPTYQSFSSILDRDMTDSTLKSEFEDRIVLVGATAEVPARELSSGQRLTELDLHVYALSSMLSDGCIAHLSESLTVGYILGLCLSYAATYYLLSKRKHPGRNLLPRACLAIVVCLGFHLLVLLGLSTRGLWVDGVHPAGGVLLYSGTLTFLFSRRELHSAHQELEKSWMREKTLEGVAGLGLEIIGDSHIVSGHRNVPWTYRLWLLTRIVDDILDRTDSLAQQNDAVHPVSEVIKASLARTPGTDMSQVTLDFKGNPFEIDTDIGKVSCSISLLSDTNPVPKPYLMQRVLEFLLTNALQAGPHRLAIQVDHHRITIVDDGDPFREETLSALHEESVTVLRELRSKLEEIESIRRQDSERAFEDFDTLPLGIGLLLSKLLIEKLYGGTLEITGHIPNRKEVSIFYRTA